MIKNKEQNKANTKVIQPNTKSKVALWWKIIPVMFVCIALLVVGWFAITRNNTGSNNETVNYQAWIKLLSQI